MNKPPVLLPTTACHQSRLQIFQPTMRPMRVKREVATAWGKAIVDGRTGQQHATILEFMLKTCLDHGYDKVGRLVLLVDPYQLSLAMSETDGQQYSYEVMHGLVTDLQQTTVDIHPANDALGRCTQAQIIATWDRHNEATAKNPGYKSLKNESERTLWRVYLHERYVQYFLNDLHLFYDPKPIASLRTGVAQAIVRHIKTHSKAPNGGWDIDRLLVSVGAICENDTPSNKTKIRNRRRDIKSDQDGLKLLGFCVKDGKIQEI